MPENKADASIQAEFGRPTAVTVQYEGRTMKFYHVTENELDSLSLLNTHRLGFVSAGSLLIGIALPDAYSWAFPTAGATPVDGKKIVFFMLGAIACFAVAWWHQHKAQKVWGKINEPKPPSP